MRKIGAIADWQLLNALINAVGGASWVSIHHGGGGASTTASTPGRSSAPMGLRPQQSACSAR
ncbi:MAG: hypothetical protein JSV81_19955 [Anaerolineales bacterium]|nr:MAG: hypothetical protein JSV81_19955 [Anaerolineales bacterium]